MMREVPIGVTLPEALVVEHTRSGSFADVKSLTLAISRGDEEAFNVFYREYSTRVYRLLIAFTRGDEVVARELHQAVMLKAARKLKVFETDRELWAWLTAVGRNEWRDHCRRRGRDLKRVGGAGNPNEAEKAVNPSAGERLRILNEALLDLSAVDRELVESFYVDELSQAELAQRSGRTVKAVQCALARIRARLKKMIEAKR